MFERGRGIESDSVGVKLVCVWGGGGGRVCAIVRGMVVESNSVSEGPLPKAHSTGIKTSNAEMSHVRL